MDYYSLKSIVVLLLLLIAVGVFLYRSYLLLWDNMRHGQPSGSFAGVGNRLAGLLKYVAGQFRLFRFLVPGTSHFFIFWGFLILAPTILVAILEGLLSFYDPNFHVPILGEFGPLALLQDILAVAVIVAVIIDLYIRVGIDPERYKGSHKREGVRVLIYIFTLMVSLLVFNAVRISMGTDPLAAWRPISSAASRLFVNTEVQTQLLVAETAYWVHLAVVLVFLTELPGGKHFHVVTSLPALYLRNLKPRGQLPPAPEFNGDVGVQRIEQFKWRQMLDFYTCTECGRCQEVCPAYASGMNLSPKLLMMDLRDELMKVGEQHRRTKGVNGGGTSPVVGKTIASDSVWACMTCLACDEECPLFIEHVVPIVDLRRHLVMEGEMDEMLQEALANLGRYGNSFGQSERARAKWTRGLDWEIKDARRDGADYLWFLGDYASYHASCTEVTTLTAEVFKQAGLDFAILYDDEKNAGNDVRRTGEEGLFEMLREENLDTLNRCRVKHIVTTDPHTYNTLKNEYSDQGWDGDGVLHYSELFDDLIRSGQLRLSKRLGYRVTYHDPCYLGRYNGVYDAPRRVIEATGCELVEMQAHRDRAICCGAGGGRIWMEEHEAGERPSEARIREAMQIEGVMYFVVACPKDLTMFKDAVKTAGYEGKIVVKELVELVYESLVG